MKSKKNILKVIGLCLIILQILSILGLSRGRGLYLSGSSIYSSRLPSGFNIVYLDYATKAGLESFIISFRDLLTFSDEWVPPTPTQAMSGHIRDSLQGISLFIYDALLTICYASAGIVGVILLIVYSKMKRKREENSYGDMPPTSSCAETSWDKFLK